MRSGCDVSIVIVNFNGQKYLDNLLQSLCEMDLEELTYEVVVVDNCSSDDSVAYMKKNYQGKMPLKIVESKENLGFAGGNNKGVQEAEGKYLIFLNNDTKVDRRWLTELYHFAQGHPDCGMINSKLLFFYDFVKITFSTDDKMILQPMIRINGQEYQIDNKFCKNVLLEKDKLTCFGHSEISMPLLTGDTDYRIEIECKEAYGSYNEMIACGIGNTAVSGGKTIISIEKELVRENKYCLIQNAGSGINKNFDGYDIGFCEKDSEKYTESYELSNGCGAAIMLLREDFMKCGGFDEQFFMYYEDTDLSFRIKKLGKKILFCPTAVVRHVHTGSSKEWSPFFCYQVARNKLLFVYKNISKIQFWKFFCRQMISAVKYGNQAQKQGNLDAVRIALFHKKCSFAK